MRINSSVIPGEVKFILGLFERHEYEIYIVGGAVRDLLLGRQTYDWDFTTNATPEEMLKFVPDSFYDNKYGTIGVKQPGRPFEITTFRTEKGYSDNRHPDEIVWGKTLEDDLSRREFTISAMALRQVQGKTFEVIDLFGGQKDLENKIIRTVGNPDKRFGEDALRMIRAVRIASQLAFAIEEETFAAIKRNAASISKVAWERIRDELLKIMACDFPADGYMLLRNTGLGEIILPEMEKTFGVNQKAVNRHHLYDVGTHCVQALRFCTSSDPITRLATLVHDAGKAVTVKTFPDGRVTFYNHEMESEKIAENIASRLRFSTEQRDKFVRLVRWHQFSVDERQTDSAVRRFIVNVGKENISDMLALRTGDRLGGGARETSWRLEEFKKRIIQVQQQPFTTADLKVDGYDVMKMKNISSGPKVGEYLTVLFNEVVENKLPNEREILLKKLEEINL